jgi:hypothetical protein
MRSTLPLFALALASAAPVLATETVPVPGFRGVELRGGGNVTVIPGVTQRVTILEGSSEFTRIYVDREGKLKIDACNERCPHLYRLQIRVESPRVPDLAVNGGGAINVAGGFRPQGELNAAVNGGGKIDARAIDASDVAAAVNGGGELLVRPRTSLSAAVNGGGAVRYWGNPSVAMAVHGGGSVRPGN